MSSRLREDQPRDMEMCENNWTTSDLMLWKSTPAYDSGSSQDTGLIPPPNTPHPPTVNLPILSPLSFELKMPPKMRKKEYNLRKKALQNQMAARVLMPQPSTQIMANSDTVCCPTTHHMKACPRSQQTQIPIRSLPARANYRKQIRGLLDLIDEEDPIPPTHSQSLPPP